MTSETTIEELSHKNTPDMAAREEMNTAREPVRCATFGALSGPSVANRGRLTAVAYGRASFGFSSGLLRSFP